MHTLPLGAGSDFPPDFTDRDGSRWYRGKKRLGAGGYGEVWLGMPPGNENWRNSFRIPSASCVMSG